VRCCLLHLPCKENDVYAQIVSLKDTMWLTITRQRNEAVQQLPGTPFLLLRILYMTDVC